MTMDRLEPTRRPPGKPSGWQKWRSLSFLHWTVPVAAVRRAVPPALELDLWQGEAFVGIVPFAMRDIAPHWWPRRWSFNFLETNLRTYVHYRGRPGVYFLSLDANSRLAVRAARYGWGLPYYDADMTLATEGDLHYASQRPRHGAAFQLRCRPGAFLGASQPGTVEHFLLERYLLFVERSRRIFVGQVSHSPYPVQRLQVVDVRESLAQAAGLPPLAGPPALAHYAAGVDVEVFGLNRAANGSTSGEAPADSVDKSEAPSRAYSSSPMPR